MRRAEKDRKLEIKANKEQLIARRKAVEDKLREKEGDAVESYHIHLKEVAERQKNQ